MNKSQKKKKLASLTDEIRELHPLLERLLPMLPEVKQVEYTHGTREKGADFVLQKHDSTLDNDVFVGVIAKIGAVKQDYSKVTTQITECVTLKRFFQGGKKQIVLSEVWVVSTAHISENAQEKIHQQFRTSNVQFIPGDRLIEYIDNYMRDYWTDIDVHIGAFLATAGNEIARIDAQSMLGQLGDGDFYIEQDVSRRLSDRYTQKRKRAKEKVNLLEVISRDPLVIIEGCMGSGKSKLIRHTTQQLCEAEYYLEHKLLPVYMPFQRLLDDYGSDLRRAISDVVPNHALEALHANEGRLVVFVDGFDEKNLAPDDQLKFLQELQKFSVHDGQMSIVIATRFLTDCRNTYRSMTRRDVN